MTSPAGSGGDRVRVGETARSLLDGVLLSVPPVVLVGVFLLPRPVRESLVFVYGTPTPATALTANYVHFSIGHLLSNVLGYLLVVTVAYLLSTYGGFGDLFRAASVAFLVALAPALSVLNLAVPRPGTAFGFSGVAISFYGLLCFALGRYADRRVVHDRTDLPRAVFFFAAGMVAVVANPTPVTGAVVGLVPFAAAAVHVAGVSEPLREADWRAAIGDERRGALLVAGGTLVVTYPLAAFPTDPTLDGGLVNLYGHFLGFAIGFIVVWAVETVDARTRGD